MKRRQISSQERMAGEKPDLAGEFPQIRLLRAMISAFFALSGDGTVVALICHVNGKNLSLIAEMT